jgi:hypothetical protein
LTRGKAVLVGALAIALAGVLYRQYGAFTKGDATTSAVEARPVQAPRPTLAPAPPYQATGVPAADTSLDSALAEFDKSKWQAPELAKVIEYDPFALPKTFPQPPRAVVDPALAAEGGDASSAALDAQQLADAVEQMQSQLEELKQRGVHVIVNLNDEYVAVIGDRTVHVGDEINGFIVTAIEPDGVRIEGKALQ